MTLFKVEGQKIYIFKTPSQDHVPESHTSVISIYSPLPWGSPAIPLVIANYRIETVNNDKRNSNKKLLPDLWSSDYLMTHIIKFFGTHNRYTVCSIQYTPKQVYLMKPEGFVTENNV